MALDKWKKKKEQVTTRPEVHNLIGKVIGYAADNSKALVQVMPTNPEYSGPTQLAVSLSEEAGPDSIQVQHMADPDNDAYKEASAETGGIIELRSASLTGEKLLINDHEFGEAKCLFFKSVLNNTRERGRAVILPNVSYHQELIEAQKRNVNGEPTAVAPRINTTIYQTANAVACKDLAQVESEITTICDSSSMPGRNSVGVTLQINVDGDAMAVPLVPRLSASQNGAQRKPLAGSEALKYFKSLPVWKELVVPMLTEFGGKASTLAIPTISTSSSPTEAKQSGYFDDSGKLTKLGEMVRAQNVSEDTDPVKLASLGTVIFRAVGAPTENSAQPVRFHSGVPHRVGKARYDNTLDLISSPHFKSNSPCPASLASRINAEARAAKFNNTPDSSQSNDEHEALLAELDNQLPPSAQQSIEDDFDPFGPADFGDDQAASQDSEPGLNEVQQPTAVQQQAQTTAPAQSAVSDIEQDLDFDSDVDFSQELNESLGNDQSDELETADDLRPNFCR